MNKKVNFSVAQDAEYTTYCMKEALRYRPAVNHSQFMICKKDVTLGKYNFKKGDELTIAFEGLAQNPNEW